MSDFKKIEKKWQKYWDKNKTFEVTEDKDKKPYYILVEFVVEVLFFVYLYKHKDFNL